MKKSQLTIFLIVSLFSLVLISWPQEVSDYITGAAEVFDQESKYAEKKYSESGKDLTFFEPSKELLEGREEEYERINIVGSGISTNYGRVLERGIRVNYLPDENKLIRVYNPNGDLVKEFEANEEVRNIMLEEEDVFIGVYEINEETINGERLSQNYFLVKSPDKELSKEEIEEMYNIEEEEIKIKYEIEKDISSVLFNKLAEANIIEETSKSQDFRKVKKILGFNDFQKGILNIVDIFEGKGEAFLSPVKEDLPQTIVKKIEIDPEIKLSPGDKFMSFGIYLSDEKGNIIDEDYSGLDLLIIEGIPKISLDF